MLLMHRLYSRRNLTSLKGISRVCAQATLCRYEMNRHLHYSAQKNEAIGLDHAQSENSSRRMRSFARISPRCEPTPNSVVFAAYTMPVD